MSQPLHLLPALPSPSPARPDVVVDDHLGCDVPFKVAKRRLVDEFEVKYLRDLIARHRGNISAASRASKLSRRHLRTLMDRHGIGRESTLQ